MFNKFLALSVFGLAISLPAAFASSTSLATGSSVTPLVSDGSALPATLAAPTITGTFVATPSTAFSGSYSSAVYLDPTTGGYDFFYQVSNNGPDTLARISMTSFAGFTTSVAYLTGADAIPAEADRNTADTVGFDINDPAGKTSDWLEIQTNATSFYMGDMYVQDGGQAQVVVYSPTPEPMSMSLLGAGLVGLGLLRLRRRAVKA